MKKTIATVLLLAALCGCISNFEDYNTPPYSIPDMQPQMLIPAMCNHLVQVQTGGSQMIDQMVGSLGGYFAVSNRFGGQNFDTFNVSDTWNANPYSTPFTGIYANYFEILRLTDSSSHYFALARIIRASVMLRVTDLYGGIPYSKVADGLTYVPYDTQQEVYRNIIRDLREGAAVLAQYTKDNPGKNPLGGNDPVYGGDYAGWVRLANSMILRAAIRSSDREAFRSAASDPGGLIQDNSQNAFLSTGLQINPYQIASASWGDLRINSSIADYMEGYGDPRAKSYFTGSTFESHSGKYVGMRTGEAAFQSADVRGYSMPAVTKTSPIPVMTAAEVRFLLAEAALEGWTDGKPGDLYAEGIRLSMEQYGVPAAEAEKYITDNSRVPAGHKNDPRGNKYDYERKTKVTVAWDEGASQETKMEKIITQKWIAIYPLGLEAWAEFRRTGYPELAPVMDNLSGGIITDNVRGMRRLRYPFTEKEYNKANYDKAVSLLGGPDNEATELFWTAGKH